MAVPSLVLDGSMNYGTPLITCSNGETYKLNNIEVSRPNSKAMDRTEKGKPQRQRWTADVATMTAEAQIPSSGVFPKFGDTFSLTLDSNYGVELWVVMPADYKASNGEGDINVCPIRCEKVLNGAVTTVA